MKKRILFFAVLISLFLTGCKNGFIQNEFNDNKDYVKVTLSINNFSRYVTPDKDELENYYNNLVYELQYKLAGSDEWVIVDSLDFSGNENVFIEIKSGTYDFNLIGYDEYDSPIVTGSIEKQDINSNPNLNFPMVPYSDETDGVCKGELKYYYLTLEDNTDFMLTYISYKEIYIDEDNNITYENDEHYRTATSPTSQIAGTGTDTVNTEKKNIKYTYEKYNENTKLYEDFEDTLNYQYFTITGLTPGDYLIKFEFKRIKTDGQTGSLVFSDYEDDIYTYYDTVKIYPGFVTNNLNNPFDFYTKTLNYNNLSLYETNFHFGTDYVNTAYIDEKASEIAGLDIQLTEMNDEEVIFNYCNIYNDDKFYIYDFTTYFYDEENNITYNIFNDDYYIEGLYLDKNFTKPLKKCNVSKEGNYYEISSNSINGTLDLYAKFLPAIKIVYNYVNYMDSGYLNKEPIVSKTKDYTGEDEITCYFPSVAETIYSLTNSLPDDDAWYFSYGIFYDKELTESAMIIGSYRNECSLDKQKIEEIAKENNNKVELYYALYPVKDIYIYAFNDEYITSYSLEAAPDGNKNHFVWYGNSSFLDEDECQIYYYDDKSTILPYLKNDLDSSIRESIDDTHYNISSNIDGYEIQDFTYYLEYTQFPDDEIYIYVKQFDCEDSADVAVTINWLATFPDDSQEEQSVNYEIGDNYLGGYYSIYNLIWPLDDSFFEGTIDNKTLFGFYYDEDFTELVENEKILIEPNNFANGTSITLYPKYIEPINLVYHVNGNEVDTTNLSEYGLSEEDIDFAYYFNGYYESFLLPLIEAPNGTFEGWYLDDTYTDKKYISTEEGGEKSLFVPKKDYLKILDTTEKTLHLYAKFVKGLTVKIEKDNTYIDADSIGYLYPYVWETEDNYYVYKSNAPESIDLPYISDDYSEMFTGWYYKDGDGNEYKLKFDEEGYYILPSDLYKTDSDNTLIVYPKFIQNDDDILFLYNYYKEYYSDVIEFYMNNQKLPDIKINGNGVTINDYVIAPDGTLYFSCEYYDSEEDKYFFYVVSYDKDGNSNYYDMKLSISDYLNIYTGGAGSYNNLKLYVTEENLWLAGGGYDEILLACIKLDDLSKTDADYKTYYSFTEPDAYTYFAGYSGNFAINSFVVDEQSKTAYFSAYRDYTGGSIGYCLMYANFEEAFSECYVISTENFLQNNNLGYTNFGSYLSNNVIFNDMYLYGDTLYVLFNNILDIDTPYTIGGILQINTKSKSIKRQVSGLKSNRQFNYFSGHDYYAQSSMDTTEELFAPKKIIGYKLEGTEPKKLLISDDGYFIYTEGENGYFKNVNRIVEFDLETATITNVTSLGNGVFEFNDCRTSDISSTFYNAD